MRLWKPYEPFRTPHEYRTTLAGPYIIYYRYNATTLTVYRIMHQRQSIDTYSLIEY